MTRLLSVPVEADLVDSMDLAFVKQSRLECVIVTRLVLCNKAEPYCQDTDILPTRLDLVVTRLILIARYWYRDADMGGKVTDWIDEA